MSARRRTYVRWTPERIEWLRREAPAWTAPQLARRFEREFFVRPSATAIHCAGVRFGIAIGAGATWDRGRPRTHGPEVEAWFREAARGRTLTELAQAFAERLGGRPAINRIRSFAEMRGIRLDELRARLPNNGRFGPGRQGIPDAPIGTEKVLPARMRKGRLGGETVMVKTAPGSDGWEPKARVVWERAHGRAPPEGHAVLHLDGDPRNCEPANLELVSRRALGLINKRGELARAPVALRRVLVQAARVEVAAKRRAEGVAA